MNIEDMKAYAIMIPWEGIHHIFPIREYDIYPEGDRLLIHVRDNANNEELYASFPKDVVTIGLDHENYINFGGKVPGKTHKLALIRH